jgi:phage baseplate assembly protein W
MEKIIGYTTRGQETTSQTLTGLQLAIRDLENHFRIRKGEKWTNPEFGSMLPYYVFQPLDDATISLIEDDVMAVVTYDPRFELRSSTVRVDEDELSVTVRVELLYLPTTTETDLEIKFDKEFQEAEQF